MMTPAEFKAIRRSLGLSLEGTARLFRMGKYGRRNVIRWEQGQQDIPGWAAFIFEAYRDGLPEAASFNPRYCRSRKPPQ